MTKLLSDITDPFWDFIEHCHSCISGEEIKELKCYKHMNNLVKNEETYLLYIKHSHIFPDTKLNLKLPSNIQRIVFEGLENCIYIFSDIHEVFHGVRYLMLINKQEETANKISKCIMIMENYIDIQNITDKINCIDLIDDNN